MPTSLTNQSSNGRTQRLFNRTQKQTKLTQQLKPKSSSPRTETVQEKVTKMSSEIFPTEDELLTDTDTNNSTPDKPSNPTNTLTIADSDDAQSTDDSYDESDEEESSSPPRKYKRVNPKSHN